MMFADGPRIGVGSLGIFVNLVLFSFGNLPAFPFALLILGLLLFLLNYVEKQVDAVKNTHRRRWAFPVFIFAFCAIWGMFFVMYAKLPVMDWPDFQRWSYGLPTIMCIFFLTGLLIGLIRAPAAKTAIRVAFCIILLCNIMALPDHDSKVKTGGYFNNVVANSPFLRDALLNVYNPNYNPQMITNSNVIYNNTYDHITIYDSLKKYALEHSRAAQPLLKWSN